MNPYYQQVAPRLRIQEKERKVDSSLIPDRGELQNKIKPAGDSSKGRFYVISKLENCVSILQIARINIEKIKDQLSEMGNFLEKEIRFFPATNIPVSVVNNYLTERVSNIKMISEATSFNGKALLNGNCGVKTVTKGKGLRFVKGSPYVASSDEGGYPVKILELPEYSGLIGTKAITAELLGNEELISISDDEKELNYRITKEETIESLIPNLQKRLHEKGFNISVYKTKNNFLYFKHNQLGDENVFKGTSLKTQLISKYPGQAITAMEGKNIVGKIGDEPTKGEGGFLTGLNTNKKTRGLTLYFDGTNTEQVNQIVGHVLVKQNGLLIPLDLEGRKAEILSLPSLTPELLATGIPNSSGFLNLKSVRVHSPEELKDSLLLIYRSIKELKSLNKDLVIKENYYVNLAVEMLRLTMKPKAAGVEVLSLSKEKASEMAEQLKGMLSPQLMVEPTM
jgi:hypothetical protein